MATEAKVIHAGPAQARAASPETFVWVSANAGSGKTHVLVDRLARLLLGGTDPGRILCLTFTNAAAAEMANRLFDRLAGWAMAEDDLLSDVLEGLTHVRPDAATLTRARQLFALALESPGGLKIHTIHAFCTRVLQRFPLEAGVAPNFTQLDERGQAEHLADIRETVMAEAAKDPGGALAQALDTVSRLMHDMRLDDLFGEFLKRRRQLLAIGDDALADALIEQLAGQLGVAEGDRRETDILARHFGPQFDRSAAADAATHLATGSTRDIECVSGMAALAARVTPEQALAAHQSLFLTQKGDVRKSLMTAPLRKANPGLGEWVDGELDRAARLRAELARARTLEATRAGLVLGRHIVTAYEAAKRRETLLDYDDLILKTGELLAHTEDAEWVLYKLDGGIDHILVDEAQDTSPEQWEIVRRLSEDMMSGASARARGRTVFAVGDEKQSIFSFQGADPEKFDEMRGYFSARVAEAKLLWDAVPLEESFRSTPDILAAVDAVFSAEQAAAGLSAPGSAVRHSARREAPGLVEVWPVTSVDKDAKPDPWTVPVDVPRPGSSLLVLAAEIAAEIAGWLDERRELTPRGRPVEPGDILILVRRRNAFVDAVVRELKARDVPVAGVDRMRLTDQIAVEDLMALGRFAALPEDDLTLATLLKSPLIGLTEHDLFEIAHGRDGSLWDALRARAALDDGGEGRFAAAAAALAEALAGADQVPPFEFYSRFLAVPGRREAIHRRLGIEADDPITEFLDAALAYERQDVPTLDGFLAWLARGRIEIKREMDQGKNEVRVMTVHGAKGLEANIVILPDTCAGAGGHNRFALDDIAIEGRDIEVPVWLQGPADAVAPVEAARAARKDKEAAEYRRLLYVAMTRACDWLIVTGYLGRENAPPEGCWYDLIASGLGQYFDGEREALENGRVRYRLSGARPGAPDAEQPTAPQRAVTVALPPWALQAPESVAAAPRLTPSVLGDEGAPPALSPLSETREQRFRRGNLIHRLLEILPATAAEDRAEAARRYIGIHGRDIDANLRDEIAREALAVVAATEFAPFLAPEARAEVPFSAMVGEAGRQILVEGQVDRLALIGSTLHVLDYKTHRPAAETLSQVPRGIMRQMALYRAALSPIFEAREVEISILWTNHARLMPLPHEALDTALREALARGGHA